MPDPSSDYITKTEAAIIYRRSERSLSRDITNAIKFREAAVLSNVELRLEDGTRRPGSQLTIDEIVQLRDNGLNPTWLLKRGWLQQSFGQRNEPRPPNLPNPSPQIPADASAETPPLPDDLAQRVAVLFVQNEALRQTSIDLRAQAQRLEKELDRRAEERREENELQKQNNVLMQQVYDLLERMQRSSGQITVLPAPRQAATDLPVEIDVTHRRQSTRPAEMSTAKKRGPARQTTSRRRQRKAASTDNTSASTAMSRFLPTLDRAVRFLSRK